MHRATRTLDRSRKQTDKIQLQASIALLFFIFFFFYSLFSPLTSPSFTRYPHFYIYKACRVLLELAPPSVIRIFFQYRGESLSGYCRATGCKSAFFLLLLFLSFEAPRFAESKTRAGQRDVSSLRPFSSFHFGNPSREVWLAESRHEAAIRLYARARARFPITSFPR